ncbi:hypothetical protein [Acaryochloris marina]|uniref:hypothetical protein n=1 Tax=Acaryochloris marina TaxID=155978 RepID=UPI0021C32AB6|nr:hypothetical protein [Acaryochloris marina]
MVELGAAVALHQQKLRQFPSLCLSVISPSVVMIKMDSIFRLYDATASPMQRCCLLRSPQAGQDRCRGRSETIASSSDTQSGEPDLFWVTRDRLKLHFADVVICNDLNLRSGAPGIVIDADSFQLVRFPVRSLQPGLSITAVRSTRTQQLCRPLAAGIEMYALR